MVFDVVEEEVAMVFAEDAFVAEGQVAIAISVTEKAQCLIVELHDQAERMFHPNMSQSQEGLEATRGRGIQLIAGLLDDVRYVSAKGEAWRYVISPDGDTRRKYCG